MTLSMIFWSGRLYQKPPGLLQRTNPSKYKQIHQVFHILYVKKVENSCGWESSAMVEGMRNPVTLCLQSYIRQISSYIFKIHIKGKKSLKKYCTDFWSFWFTNDRIPRQCLRMFAVLLVYSLRKLFGNCQTENNAFGQSLIWSRMTVLMERWSPGAIKIHHWVWLGKQNRTTIW